jgi:hypothetical protein
VLQNSKRPDNILVARTYSLPYLWGTKNRAGILFDALCDHPTVLTSIIVIVTPITSIVKDQVLNKKPLPAVHVTSAVGVSADDAI